MMENEEPSSTPGSLHSRTGTPVRFINHSRSRVKLFWLDYQGRQVLYSTLEPSNGHYDVDTYVTHPWIAFDEQTNQPISIWIPFMEAQIPTPPLFVCSTSENCIQGAQNSVGFESIFRQALSCPKSDKYLIFPLSYNITPESNITITNSTCQHLRNCIENGMMNMHTDARV